MPIAVQCSGCGGKFRASDEAAGKLVKCPKCSVVIRVGGISQRQTRPAGASSLEREGGNVPVPHPSPAATSATRTASPAVKAVLASSGSALKNRLLSGLLLVIISPVAFFWSSMFDGHFFGETRLISAHAPHVVVPEAVLTYTFLTLGIMCATGGLLLLVGGPVASRIYVAIGLAQEPQREMRLLTSMLQLCAVWHVSIGWLISEMATKAAGGEVIRVFWLVVVFGAVPGVLAPFCLRGKRWSLWTVSVIFSLVFLIYAAGFVYLAYQSVRAKLALADFLDVRIIYVILAGCIAGDAWWLLWRSRPTAQGYAVATELRRLLSLHDALLDAQRESKPLWVPIALSGIGALVSFIAVAIAYALVCGQYHGNDARIAFGLFAMLIGGVATFIVVRRLAAQSGKRKEQACRAALNEAVGQVSASCPAVVAAVGSRERLLDRRAVADALTAVGRCRGTREARIGLPPHLPPPAREEPLPALLVPDGQETRPTLAGTQEHGPQAVPMSGHPVAPGSQAVKEEARNGK